MNMKQFFIILQKLLPQHALSRTLGMLASSERRLIAQPLIRAFMRAYNISLQEAQRKQPHEYHSFNDFFTRALESNARPITRAADSLICPADGYVSQIGSIHEGTLLQAKGVRYSLAKLLGEVDASKYAQHNGRFVTIYLAPSNYHRVHAPTDGQLHTTIAVPGKLFSVNDTTANAIPGLFSRNERLVCHYDNAHGPVSLVFVGAMIVASIETVWRDAPSPYRNFASRRVEHAFRQGDELGRFLLGSTVILSLPANVHFDAELTPGTAVRMGQVLGRWIS